MIRCLCAILIDSESNDASLSASTRRTEENMFLELSPRNLLTQQFPTWASFPFSLFLMMQTFVIGWWPHRHCCGSSLVQTCFKHRSARAACHSSASLRARISRCKVSCDMIDTQNSSCHDGQLVGDSFVRRSLRRFTWRTNSAHIRSATRASSAAYSSGEL